VTQPELETLSIRTATADKEKLGISEVPIPESIKPVVNELIKNRGRWLSANQIAERTGRSRNLESSYLQKLFEKGYLVRQRIGRNVYYSIHNEN
jgi:biotin operon repressor